MIRLVSVLIQQGHKVKTEIYNGIPEELFESTTNLEKLHDFQEDGPVNKTEKTENLSESKMALSTSKVAMVYLLIKNESICPVFGGKCQQR